MDSSLYRSVHARCGVQIAYLAVCVSTVVYLSRFVQRHAVVEHYLVVHEFALLLPC